METVDWGIRTLLEKQARVPRLPAAEDHAAESADAEEYTAFAHGRVGLRPQMTLVFRKCGGEEEGFSYAHYSRIRTTDRSRGFTVEFGEIQVKVEGRNLERLFLYVCSHRAVEIVEAERTLVMTLPETEPVVERIQFQEKAKSQVR